MSRWRKVGKVGVDAGLLMVGDPCYHMHRGKRARKGAKEILPPFPEFKTDWRTFCDEITKKGIDREGFAQIGASLAVVTRTGVGDGLYDVWVRFSENGRMVEAVKVVFVPRRKRA